jgi:hypothetical protein
MSNPRPYGNRTRRASKPVRTSPSQGIRAVAKNKATRLSAQCAQLPDGRGASIVIAAGRSILVAGPHVLDQQVPYRGRVADRFIRPDSPERQVRKLVGQLAALREWATLSKPAA